MTAIQTLTDWIINDNNSNPVDFTKIIAKPLRVNMLILDSGFCACKLEKVRVDEDEELFMDFSYEFPYGTGMNTICSEDPHAEELAERVRLYINELANFEYLPKNPKFTL